MNRFQWSARRYGLLIALLVLSRPLLGESEIDVRTLLKRELVAEVGGKLLHDQVNRCQILLPPTLGGGLSDPFHVQRHIEAPADLISRDNFVLVSARIFLNNRVVLAQALAPEITPAEAVGALRCRPVDQSVTQIDFLIKVIMDADGVQLEVRDTGSGKWSLERSSWAQMLDLQR